MDNYKKKVAILSNGLVYGGTDTFVMNLLKGIDYDKYEITIILSVNGNENATREKEAIDSGAKILKTCALKGFKGRIEHLVKLYKLLKRNQYDVFHTNIDLFNGPNLFIAWLAGIKIRVCHSHNTQQEKAIGNKTILLSLYQHIMKRLCWTFSNRRTGCSSEAMDFLFTNKWKNDSHSLVVYNGIDLSQYQDACDTIQKRKSLNLSAKNIILTVGRLVDQKNPLFTEAVIYELCKMRDDCEFIFAGNGYLEPDLRKLLKKHNIEDKVHLLGNRTDVNELMQCSDLFLLPSKFEGLGIVYIEAQAAGLNCIASTEVPKLTDCGGMHYFKLTDNPKIWAKNISNMLDTKHHPEIDSNKLEKFTISNMAEQMMHMFE